MDEVDEAVSRRNERGVQLTEEGKYDEALKEFQRALFLNPNAAVLHTNRAEVLLAKGDYRAAAACYDRALELEPDNVVIATRLAEIHFLEGKAFAEENQHQEAIFAFSRAIQLGDSHTETYRAHRAQSYVKLGNLAAAIGDLTHCIDNHLDNVSSERKAELLLARAKLVQQLDNYAATSMDVAAALLHDPNNADALQMQATVRDKVGSYVNDARMLMISARFSDALVFIDSGLSVVPSDYRLLLLRATANRNLGNYREALVDLAQAAQHAPPREQGEAGPGEVVAQTSLVYSDWGARQAASSDFEAAVINFTKAIRFHEDKTSLYLSRGECYREMRRPHLAAADYHRALELDPSSKDTKQRLALVYCDFGMNEFATKQFAQAEFEFTEAIKLDNRVGEYFFRRAKARVILQRLETARNDLLACIRLEADHGAAWELLDRYCPNHTRAEIRQMAAKLPRDRYTS